MSVYLLRSISYIFNLEEATLSTEYGTSLPAGVMPVSYTHLDVYKRQRVHSPEFSLITSVYQILQYSATRLMYIIRSPYSNYTLGTKQLGCYHIIHWFSFKLGYKYIPVSYTHLDVYKRQE